MKFTIDKEYTTLSQLPKVKQDCKEFKAMYTDNDLLRAFQDTTGIYRICNYEVLRATVEAFPAGSFYGDETSFSVELLCYGFTEFIKVRFYCDLNLEVSTDELMWFGDPSENPHRKLYSMEVFTSQNS